MGSLDMIAEMADNLSYRRISLVSPACTTQHWRSCAVAGVLDRLQVAPNLDAAVVIETRREESYLPSARITHRKPMWEVEVSIASD